ncbi:unnamed protein product [Spirodela intermedia]|uniref:Uncharacterized protein n=1 Tax=Spirodela intermedia TaxID=51605 RepID=A0A7I8JX73_SPIIN|nr:unnamed protein product [Spirodela intermedia]
MPLQRVRKPSVSPPGGLCLSDATCRSRPL